MTLLGSLKWCNPTFIYIRPISPLKKFSFFILHSSPLWYFSTSIFQQKLLKQNARDFAGPLFLLKKICKFSCRYCELKFHIPIHRHIIPNMERSGSFRLNEMKTKYLTLTKLQLNYKPHNTTKIKWERWPNNANASHTRTNANVNEKSRLLSMEKTR